MGALVGNEIERRSRRGDEDFRVGIRIDDGLYRVRVTQDDPNLRIGDRVSVEGDRVYRYSSFPSDLSVARFRRPAARMSPPRQGDDRFQAGIR